MKVTHLMSIRRNIQGTRERFKEISEGHFASCVVFLQCPEIDGDCSEIHSYRPSSSYHAVPADRRNKTLECWLATPNASSAIMSHALEQIKAAGIGVICKSASIAPHFLLARVQLSICFSYKSFPHICVLPTAFKKLCSNKRGLLTGTSCGEF